MPDLPKKQCTGCSACFGICPNGSIGMIADGEGFLYPAVDRAKCVGCRLCEDVCPVLRKPAAKDCQGTRVFAAWSLDGEVRRRSTSGGIFTELAKAVIGRGGYVAGARYDDAHLVGHRVIASEWDIPLLRQSKYVQSDMGAVFREVKELLEKGRPFLFAGCPCQVAGLLGFLGRDYDNLLLCDFICRGVNSPKAYKKYLESLEKQYRSKIRRVWFKNKTLGWNRFGTRIEFEDGTEYFADRDTDPFMRGYLNYNLYLRPSCSDCSFKGFPRHSDITLADFWGIRLRDGSVDEDGGTSLVMLHTQKGRELFESIRERIFQEEHTLGEALPFNQCAEKVGFAREIPGKPLFPGDRPERFF